jgi:hypothetical protein
MGTRLYPKLSTESLLLFCGIPAEDLENALDAFDAQQRVSKLFAALPLDSAGEDPDYTLYCALRCCPVAQAHDFSLSGFGKFSLDLIKGWSDGLVPLDHPLAAELIASSSWGKRRGGHFGPNPIAALKALSCEGLYWG